MRMKKRAFNDFTDVLLSPQLTHQMKLNAAPMTELYAAKESKRVFNSLIRGSCMLPPLHHPAKALPEGAPSLSDT